MKFSNLKYTSNFNSTCDGCGAECGIIIHQHRNESILAEGDPEHPVNRGDLCSKGKDLNYNIETDTDRLLSPYIRYNRDTSLQKTDWEKAMNRIVAVMKTFISKLGPESIAFYISQNLRNEEHFLVRKLLKIIGSDNLYTDGLLAQNITPEIIKSTFNLDIPFAREEDLKLADCLLITTNVAYSHPVIWNKILKIKASKPHLKIIATGAYFTPVAAMADLYLPSLPGTEVILYQTITNYLIETGKIISDDTTGQRETFKAAGPGAISFDLYEGSQICGVNTDLIQRAAEWIGESHGFISIWAEGEETYSSQSIKDILLSLFKLHLITNHLEKPGAGLMILLQSANGRGNWELEKYYINDFGLKTQPLSDQPGKKNTEKSTQSFVENLKSGKIKALWIIGCDLFQGFPDYPIIEEVLKQAKFVIYQGENRKHEVVNYADSLLPAASRLENEGTTINTLGGLSYLPQVKTPPGETLTNIDILCRFAKKMNFHGFEYPSAENIFTEFAADLSFNGFNNTYEELAKKKLIYSGLKSNQESPSVEIKSPWINSTVSIPNVDHYPYKDDPDYPFRFEVAIFDQVNHHHYLITADTLNQNSKNTFLVLNYLDAKTFEFNENELVEVSSPSGKAKVKVIISPDIKSGCAYIYINTRGISREDLDDWKRLLGGFYPISSNKKGTSIPGLRIQKIRKKQQKIVVIGAGAAAYGFVKAYREINKTDIIEIFSKEKTPFYDRYMLPEYLSGAQAWDQLLKMSPEEEASLNLVIHRGLSILKIDRKKKLVIDSNGSTTTYDTLIMATGSRAAVPKNTPKKAGIFTMRSRNDAENFRSKVPPNAAVVIVGGGFLGLEVAASLREKGARVTIIQRTSRFLDRQLDALGSQLLHEELKDIGCEIYYNDEVQLYYGQTTLTGVGLKSGRRINCQAMVIAIGNLPNTHLAKNANLRQKVGVVVNQHLQTDDPSIFALGEIAEVKGKVYNFPEAAGEQAIVAAHYLNGDKNSFYRGSLLKNTIKLQGFNLCSIGITEAPDERYEEILLIDKKRRYYKKCILYKDRLVGAILIGDKSDFEIFGNLIANKTPLKEKRAELLKDCYPTNSIKSKHSIIEKGVLDTMQHLSAIEEDKASGGAITNSKFY